MFMVDSRHAQTMCDWKGHRRRTIKEAAVASSERNDTIEEALLPRDK
jgi:hypothetical protein